MRLWITTRPGDRPKRQQRRNKRSVSEVGSEISSRQARSVAQGVREAQLSDSSRFPRPTRSFPTIASAPSTISDPPPPHPDFQVATPHSYHYNNERPRYSSRPNADAFVSKFEVVLRFLTTRAFLLNVAFAGYCFPSLSLVCVC
ncbi:hypothetical protein CK203_030395 [Vitis vinifera]|uniref:Uncharacterized protein n=1 Tax=Vitis vinifera TaxID=29760 RepID=A0A438IVC3_VITVI|nr:hypothetical protein CK203_030395 [Vitis vinifera]